MAGENQSGIKKHLSHCSLSTRGPQVINSREKNARESFKVFFDHVVTAGGWKLKDI